MCYCRNVPNRGFNKFQIDDAGVTMKEILQKVLKRRKIRIRPGKTSFMQALTGHKSIPLYKHVFFVVIVF